MQVGSEYRIGPEIVALGFNTKEEITLPGLIIKNNSEKIDKISIINRTLFSVVCLKQNECRLGRVLVLGKQHVKACDLFTNHTLARATRVFFANFQQENLKYFPFLLYFPFCISKTCHFRAVCGMQKTGTVMRSIFL